MKPDAVQPDAVQPDAVQPPLRLLGDPSAAVCTDEFCEVLPLHAVDPAAADPT